MHVRTAARSGLIVIILAGALSGVIASGCTSDIQQQQEQKGADKMAPVKSAEDAEKEAEQRQREIEQQMQDAEKGDSR